MNLVAMTTSKVPKGSISACKITQSDSSQIKRVTVDMISEFVF